MSEYADDQMLSCGRDDCGCVLCAPIDIRTHSAVCGCVDCRAVRITP